MIYEENLKRIWVDIVNTPQIHFFNSLLEEIDNDIYMTIRNKSESIELAEKYDMHFHVSGRDYTSPLKKKLGIIYRTANLLLSIPLFDISICFQNGICSSVSKLRNRECIMFDDNDYRIALKDSMSLRLFIKAQTIANHYIVPEACYENFLAIVDKDRLISYRGYKEDISIANYMPNPNFLDTLPFEDYVVIRPEALDALYVRTNESIVTQLIDGLSKENINVLFLPREKKSYLSLYKNNTRVFIPHYALNGLDLCYYSRAILTGSGTMAREAACMGKPAVSFFPGQQLLSVDRQLVDENRMIHSRDANEIVEFVLSNKCRKECLDLSRAQLVKAEVVKIVNSIIDN